MRSASDRSLRALLGVLALGALLAWPSAAAAHPSHVVEPLVVEDFGYSPADVTIMEGRSVQWRWLNSVPHSVTSAPGAPEKFDSGLRAEGDSSFVRRFDEPGTYFYSSRTSSPQIEGVIRVMPLPTDDPEITGVDVERRGDRPVFRFELNEKLDVVLRVQEKRGGKWRTKQAISKRLAAGRSKVRARKALDKGGYRLEITAYDRYGREDTATERFVMGSGTL